MSPVLMSAKGVLSRPLRLRAVRAGQAILAQPCVIELEGSCVQVQVKVLRQPTEQVADVAGRARLVGRVFISVRALVKHALRLVAGSQGIGLNLRREAADSERVGERDAFFAAEHGIKLEVVKLPMAKRGFVLLPRRWVVERSFGWMSRFRRLARDYERLPETLVGLHFLAFVILMLKNVADVLA